MATAQRACVICGNGFLGTPRAQYCSTACRQKAHRRRSGRKRNADRNETGVTVVDTPSVTSARVHTAEALKVLRGLDAELAENARVLGQPLHWSTADEAVREMIADTIDRRTDLQRRYEASADDKTVLQLSGELRLLEAAVARLFKQVKTDMPVAPSKTSLKAARAAQSRWARENA